MKARLPNAKQTLPLILVGAAALAATRITAAGGSFRALEGMPQWSAMNRPGEQIPARGVTYTATQPPPDLRTARPWILTVTVRAPKPRHRGRRPFGIVRRDPVHFPRWTEPFDAIPLCCIKPTVFAQRKGSATRISFEAIAVERYGLDGRYRARLLLPEPGTWDYGIADSDHGNVRQLGIVTVAQ